MQMQQSNNTNFPHFQNFNNTNSTNLNIINETNNNMPHMTNNMSFSNTKQQSLNNRQISNKSFNLPNYTSNMKHSKTSYNSDTNQNSTGFLKDAKKTNFGNTSQSIVSVPNIFLIREIKSVETFNTERRNRYFKEKQLFSQAQQLNINNNPVKNHRKFEEYNKVKYQPINKIVASNIEPTNSLNTHYKRNYHSLIKNDLSKEKNNETRQLTTEVENKKFNQIDNSMLMNEEEEGSNSNPQKQTKLMEQHHHSNVEKKYEQQTEDKLKKREIGKEIKIYNDFSKNFNETMNIHHYTNPKLAQDLKNNVSKLLDRINSNYDIEKFSKSDTKTLFNKQNDVFLTPLSYYNMHNESESSKFKSTLQNKISSLSTINESNDKILDMFNRTTNYKDLENKTNEIDYSKTNPSNMPVIDEEYIDNMTTKNNFLYSKYQPTLLYNEFCSPTYSEFTKHKGQYFRKHRRQFLKDLRKPEKTIDVNYKNIDKIDNAVFNDLQIPGTSNNLWDTFYKERNEELRKLENEFFKVNNKIEEKSKNKVQERINIENINKLDSDKKTPSKVSIITPSLKDKDLSQSNSKSTLNKFKKTSGKIK